MNSDATPSIPQTPIHDLEEDTTYSLEMIASLSGINTTTILHYQERGVIHRQLDTSTLRRLRQIRHLESAFEASPPAIKLILELMDEVDSLRGMLRR